MEPKQRRDEIVRMVDRSNGVTVDELQEAFGVSGATIRRDLAILADEGRLKRFHGGAFPAAEDHGDVDAPGVDGGCESAHRAIANAAVAELEDGDAVFFDTGPITRCVASRIPESLSLLVATNSPKNALPLRETCGRVRVVGNSLRQDSDALVGRSGESFLKKTNFDVVFLETEAIQADGGLSVSSEDEARLKALMCEGGRHVVLLATRDRFDGRSFREFSTVADVDVLLTDGVVEPEMRSLLERADVRIEDDLD